MADARGKKRQRSAPEPAVDSEEGGTRLNALPDLMRRALSIGLSGFFMTEEAVRRALGDNLPKDWIDFAVDQSQRTRAEFLDRLSSEIGQALERVDLATVLSELLDGRTLEVKAQIRLGDRSAGTQGAAPRVQVETAHLEDEGDERD